MLLVIGLKKKLTWRCNSSCDAQQRIDVSEARPLPTDCQGRSWRGLELKKSIKIAVFNVSFWSPVAYAHGVHF